MACSTLTGRCGGHCRLLIAKPGELTRRYIDGERAKFVSPLALFLFSVFLLFAVVGQSLDFNQVQFKTNVAEARAEQTKVLRSLEGRRARAAQAGQPTGALDAEIRAARENVAGLEAIRDVNPGSVATFELSRNLEWLRAPVARAIANPDLLFYKVRNNAYKWSWVLIPLSAPMLWLLFPFSRRFRFYDHVVFVTYSIAFMTLLVVAVTLFSWVGLGGIGLAALAAVPVHFYLQLERQLRPDTRRRAVANRGPQLVRDSGLVPVRAPDVRDRRALTAQRQGNLAASIRVVASIRSIFLRSACGMAPMPATYSSCPMRLVSGGGQ